MAEEGKEDEKKEEGEEEGKDEGGEGEGEGEGEEEEKPNGGEETKGVVSKEDMLEMADRMGEKIAESLKGRGYSESDSEKFAKKYFGLDDNMAGIQYPDNLSNLSKDEKILTWFKALCLKDRDPRSDFVFRALNEGTAAQGGYLVPEDLRAEIFRILPDYSVMRKIARVIPTTSDSLKLNTLAARPAAYWTAEYGAKATTSAEFGQVELTPYDLVCLIPVTQQLVADANINVVNFIIQLFAETIARTEDKAFFVGSGTGQPTGIVSCSGIKTYACGGVLTFDDMKHAMYKTSQRVRTSPSRAFVASGRVIEILRDVKDSQGRYIWNMGDVSVGGPETIWGVPIYEQNDIPQDNFLFGAWEFYAIADRQSITVETTREGGDAWRRNSIEIKAVSRVDGECILNSAFVLASGVQS